MKTIGFGLLCIMLVTSSSNVMLQTADHSAFLEVFKTYVMNVDLNGYSQNRVSLEVDYFKNYW